ncbi:MAG: hypothetical protein N2C14_21230, partial [Planctomycetales bacterium]
MFRSRWLPTGCAVLMIFLATRAVAQLSPPPKQAVEIKEPEQIHQRIRMLIENLGHPDFFVRERAEAELKEHGYDAIDALKGAEDHDDLEIRKRARYLTAGLTVKFSSSDDQADVAALLKDYAGQSLRDRRARVRNLARLSGGKAAAALSRIVRFEESRELSKEAAAAVIRLPLPDATVWPHRARGILKALGASLRPGASWIRQYIRAEQDPASGLKQFVQLTSKEFSELKSQDVEGLKEDDQQAKRGVSLALLEYQSTLQRRLQRSDDARETMLKMISLEPDGSETLTQLVVLLIQEKNWKVLDEVAGKFTVRFHADAG